MIHRYISSLIPPTASLQRQDSRPLMKILVSLSWIQWAHFWSGMSRYLRLKLQYDLTPCGTNSGWLAWSCDAVDFFSVSLSVDSLSTQFSRTTHDIVLHLSRQHKYYRKTNTHVPQTTAITLTLLFRPAGAVSTER